MNLSARDYDIEFAKTGQIPEGFEHKPINNVLLYNRYQPHLLVHVEDRKVLFRLAKGKKILWFSITRDEKGFQVRKAETNL